MVNRKPLGKTLAELEASDPAVGEAARRYDETIDRLLHGTRIDRYKEHRAGICDPARCEYRHTSITSDGGGQDRESLS